MSTLAQFIGGVRPPKVLNNYWSGAGTGAVLNTFDNNTIHNPGKKFVPSLSAGALTTLLSITGSGGLDVLSFQQNTTISKNIRIKVTLDGNVIFDQTSPNISSSNQGLTVLGKVSQGISARGIVGGQPIIFNSSLLIEVSSSTADAATDFFVNYWTN